MTKADIAEKVHAAMRESGETIKVSGFGNFEIKQKNARRGRNPQIGEAITIAARKVLTFKPSSLLGTAINR